MSIVLAFLLACSDEAAAPDAGFVSDAGSISDAGTVSDAGPLPEPSIAFMSFDREVASIRYGEPASVRVSNLAPAEVVTIRARLWGYRSHAVFAADAAGVVDTATASPSEGTYEGVEPEGLVWSMALESAEMAANFDVTYSVERAGTTVAEATLVRRPLDEDLVRTSVSEDGLVGTLYVPATPGPHPAILVLGGSEGGLDSVSFSAAYYGSFGYATLGLAYFGVPGLPSSLTDIPLEYFDRALAWLAARPEIDADRLAVAGGSRGGELALMVGADHPELLAIIAEVPSGVRWGSAGVADRAAWTRDGTILPYMHGGEDGLPDIEWLPGGTRAYRYTPIFRMQMATTAAETIAAATIPIERAGGAVLLLAGADDGLWPSCELAEIAMERLRSSGHAAEHADALHCFEDAGHSIGSPGWPTGEAYVVMHPVSREWIVLGGTPRGTAHAERASWLLVRDFLEAHLR
jgi:acetyl esterase/lipase